MDTQYIKIFSKLYDSLSFSGQSKVVIEKVNELLPYADVPYVPETALEMLDLLNLPPSPEYGKELTTGAVYLLKAYFHLARGDKYMASSCINSVINIPKYRVIYGKKTLLEIQEEATRLKNTYFS